METNEITFTATKARRRRAILWTAALSSGWVFYFLIFGFKDEARIGLFLFGTAFSAIFALSITPVGLQVVRIADDGVFLYDSRKRNTRLLPWRLISDVQGLVVTGQYSRTEFLVFRSAALEWRHLLPPGAPPAEEIAAAIRARIRPEVAAWTDSLDAPAFFETVFDIRLPDTARVVHAEFHPADKSGLWSVAISREEFLNLKTRTGNVSEWFPLTTDQRFEVGGRRLVGTRDLCGEYAISRQDWESTPVLVWDADSGTLHGLLTRSVG